MTKRTEQPPRAGDPVDVDRAAREGWAEALPAAAAWGLAAVVLVIAAATLLLANPGIIDGWLGGGSGDANAAGTATDAPATVTAATAATAAAGSEAPSASVAVSPLASDVDGSGGSDPDATVPFGSSGQSGHEVLIPAIPVVPEQLDLPAGLADFAEFADRRVDMVGDSLLLSARQEMRQALDAVGSLDIDAVEGRPLSGGQSALRRIGDDDPDIVVIALGTNDLDPGDGYDELIEQSLDLTSDAECVVWVDLQEFKPGLRRINRLIRAAHPSAVAPWSTIAGPSELHTSDGYHLSPEGQEAFAEVIADTVLTEC